MALPNFEKIYKDIEKTDYFNGSTTSINDLNTDGRWRGYIPQNSDDANYLGWYGHTLVETFVQANTNPCIQRLTSYSDGRQKIRIHSNNEFSYNDVLYYTGQERNILTAIMTNDYTINTANTLLELPIDKLASKVGTKLSLSNNGIKIGAGINHIKVSGQVYWGTVNGKSGSINLLKNNVSTRFVDNNMTYNRNNIHQNIFSGVVAVVENDVIKLGVNLDTAGISIRNANTGTFLTVEVVD